MLSYLKIENLALIEHSEVEFQSGFNVITGETGAGKSILLGAIELLLGGRADRGVIRTGAERCEICALFNLSKDSLADILPLLQKADIPIDEESGELHLRRIITENGGRCHINNTPVTVRLLRELGEFLIDVHGANEHQSLISTSKQLELLDRYANSDELRMQCVKACDSLDELKVKISEFESQMPSATEAAHLGLVIDDIKAVDPQINEDDQLSVRHALASNARQIMQDTAALTAMLSDGENSITEQFTQVYRTIQELVRMDESSRGEDFLSRCAVISESIQDLSSAISDYGSGVELDPEEYMALEERLSQLHTLKRRYGPTLEQVLNLYNEALTRLSTFHSGDKKRKAFAQMEQVILDDLQAQVDKLTLLRQRSAEKLALAVRSKLGAIGFISGEIVPVFKKVSAGRNGQDLFELYFSANPGEEPQPLRKIASSGELSRLMLALKTVLSDADRVPVAIFDEIDVNIGGETASAVGAELKSLGKRRQLLAISHLPQVAVCGDIHFAVSKSTQNMRTVSHVIPLDAHGRITEIARMLGGGSAALSHAKELIRKAKSSE